jgi:hypothetical protein
VQTGQNLITEAAGNQDLARRKALEDYLKANGYQGPGVGATERVQASTIAPTTVGAAQQAGPTTVGQATVAQGPQNQARGLQMSSIQQLQDIAAGRGPDLASPQLQAGLRAASGEALGAASAATGAERAAARLEAGNAIARGGTDAAIAAAMGQAQRQQQAIGQVGAQAGALRGQDIGLAVDTAGLQQQAANLQAQLEAARQSGNAAEVNRLTALQGQINSGIATGNADLAQQAATGNAERNLRRDVAASTESRGDFTAGQQAANAAGQLAGSTAVDAAKIGQTVANTALDAEAQRRNVANEDAKRRAAGRAAITDTAGQAIAMAAHGGLVTKPTALIAGEAGPELILPVRQDMQGMAARNLSLEAKPFDRATAPSLSSVIGRALMGGVMMDRKAAKARGPY